MADEVTFSAEVDFSDPNADLLPWNYLSAGMPGRIGRSDGQTRIVMALPDVANGRPARYAAIGSDILKEPEATIKYIGELVESGMVLSSAGTAPPCSLGPATELVPPDPGGVTEQAIFDIIGEELEPIQDGRITKAVIIIDAGIAFWNRRFLGAGGPRFRSVGYFDFDRPEGKQMGILSEAEIDAFCKQAEREGNASVMRSLGALFPKSFFGAVANPDPDGLWHGTAVADLAAGAEIGEADNVALFAVELPREIIADYSGEILTGTLAMILPAAIAMASAFPSVPLTIVMPLGFPAGPQDGSHLAARSISNTLANNGRTNVRIVVPAGNHLQDRCCAQIAGAGTPPEVYWDLPPDDFSANQVEFFGTSGQPGVLPVALHIAAPGEVSKDATIGQPNAFRIVMRNLQEIGVLMRFADVGGRSRTRLALWHTAATITGCVHATRTLDIVGCGC